MIKAPVLVLGAIVALAIAIPRAPTALAASTAPGCRVSCGGTSSTPPTTSSQPDNPGGGGNGPDIPAPTPEEQTSQMAETCNAALGDLRKIPEKLVDAFANEGGASVVSVCNSGPGRQAHIDASQALPLQNAIARNFASMAALSARGFTAEDVVGVVLVKGVATLYVHKHS
ncbi:MAG: hypothetical protein ABI398_10245 [Devosia sp.]